ncbi:unnamed protein product [Amoebophrya sp. A25]|nr:unnamed protein product [Amoebophrya sp. A25]|eukprot:GSA25T00020855001.1
MSWLKQGQPRPLAATGNLVFGRLAKEHPHMRSSERSSFLDNQGNASHHVSRSQHHHNRSGQHFSRDHHVESKDALQGLLEGVRSSGYGQRMRGTTGGFETGRSLLNQRRLRNRSVEQVDFAPPRGGTRTSTPTQAKQTYANRFGTGPVRSGSSHTQRQSHHGARGHHGGHGGGSSGPEGNPRVVSAPHRVVGGGGNTRTGGTHEGLEVNYWDQNGRGLQNLTLANGFGFRTVRGQRAGSRDQSTPFASDSEHETQHASSQQHRGRLNQQSMMSQSLMSDGGGRGPMGRGGSMLQNSTSQRDLRVAGNNGSGLHSTASAGNLAGAENAGLQQAAGQGMGHQQLAVIKPRAYGAEDANPGFRPAMEDAYIIKDSFGGDPSWSYYGCYDGHGGKAVVDYTLAHLHELFLEEMRAVNFEFSQMGKVFERAFQTIDNQLRHLGCAWHCGTTCTVGLVYTPPSPAHSSAAGTAVGPNQRTNRGGDLIVETPTRTLFIGNVGDSRASLVNATTGGERLTVDHKASDPQEYARVTQEGGVISRGRVGGQLMLTRALGDFAFKSSGVTCKPYFAQRELKSDDVCVCLASDGLWDVMDEDDVARIVLARDRKHSADKLRRVAQNLVDIAKNRGSADNITACVVFL